MPMLSASVASLLENVPTLSVSSLRMCLDPIRATSDDMMHTAAHESPMVSEAAVGYRN